MAAVPTVAGNAPSADDASGPILPSEDAPETRKMWTTNWSGVSPKTVASISRVDYPWKASSFTRILLQPNWIAATAHLQLSAKQLKSNELRMRLGEGWFIDGLTVEQSTIPVNYQLPDVESGDIVLNWDRLTKEMTIRLRLAAHLSQNTEIDRLTLRAPRVVSVPGAEQEDVYAIEQAGRFRSQPDPQIQRLIVRNTDLATWQSQLVNQTDTLLLRGANAAIPELVFKSSSGTY